MAAEYVLDNIQLNPTDIVLDFGCGKHGGVSKSLLQHVSRIISSDVELDAVNKLNTRFKDQGLISSEAVAVLNSELESKYSDYFDLAVAGLVFHHIEDDQQYAQIQLIYRLLKPGGKLAIIDLQKQEEMNINGIDIDKLNDRVQAAGLDISVSQRWRRVKLPSKKKAYLHVIVATKPG